MDSQTISADDGVALHVAVRGDGSDVVVLSDRPGCVHYVSDERISPSGFRILAMWHVPKENPTL